MGHKKTAGDGPSLLTEVFQRLPTARCPSSTQERKKLIFYEQTLRVLVVSVS